MNYPVAAHFVEADFPISSLRHIGIKKVTLSPRGGDLEVLLSRREHYWIHRVTTLSPHGLNIEYDMRNVFVGYLEKVVYDILTELMS